MRTRNFIIGDVHGCAFTLQKLLFDVIKLKRSDRLHFLGDLIDRGPRSKETLETIMRLRSAGYYIVSIRGNHEEMFLNACKNREGQNLWLMNGGKTTLENFGAKEPREIHLRYRRFISDFPYYMLLDKFILVHAGINSKAVDPFKDHDAMLWSRGIPVEPERLGGLKVISAHTPQSLQEIENGLSTNYIDLDGGCVYNNHAQYGNLVALELESMSLHHTRNCDL